MDLWICPFCILRGHRSNFLNFNIFMSLITVFILANSDNPEGESNNGLYSFIWFLLQTCAKCKKRRSCTKRFSIQKFPPVLVLRILLIVYGSQVMP